MSEALPAHVHATEPGTNAQRACYGPVSFLQAVKQGWLWAACLPACGMHLIQAPVDSL